MSHFLCKKEAREGLLVFCPRWKKRDMAGVLLDSVKQRPSLSKVRRKMKLNYEAKETPCAR